MRPTPRLSPVPEQIVEAFRAIAPAVEEFAREHNLLIDRYRRGKAAWELRFARRQGGEAAITISYRERTGHVMDLSAIWFVDDFASRTRRLISEKVAVFDRRESMERLVSQLIEGLERIDAWQLDDLGPAHGPYVEWAKTHTAETFSQERARLPQR